MLADRENGGYLAPVEVGLGFGGITPSEDSLWVVDVDVDRPTGAGKADLIWVDSSSGAVYYQRGKVGLFDDVNFDTAVTIEASGQGQVSIADINGDGRVDLVRTMKDRYGVVIGKTLRLGLGDGTFDSHVYNAAFKDGGWTLGDFGLVDINGDGVQDTVFRAADQSLVVAVGRGDKRFDPVVSSASWLAGTGLGFVDTDLHFGDVNGDGRADVVVESKVAGDSRVWVRLGQKNGTFGDAVVNGGAFNSGVFGASGDVELLDVNGDGRADLVQTKTGDTLNNVDRPKAVWLAQADGTFAAQALESGIKQGKVVLGERFAADVDGDGLKDAVYRDSSNRLWVALGKAGGGYYDATVLSASQVGATGLTFQDGLRVADVDGDGKADLVWIKVDGSGSPTGGATVWRNTSINATELSFAAVATQDLSGGVGSLADRDGDGRADLVRKIWDVQRQDYRDLSYYAMPDGSFAGSQFAGNAEQFRFDVNGDGKMDWVSRDSNNVVRVALFDATQAGGYQNWVDLTAVTAPAGASFGDYLLNVDLNADGKHDLVWIKLGADRRASGELKIWLNTSTLDQVSFADNGGNSAPGAVALSDLNGDGYVDLVRQIKATNGKVDSASVFLGQASGGFAASAISGVLTKGQGGEISLGESGSGDVNGDGRQDLIFRASDNSIRIALADATRANGYQDWVSLSGAQSGVPSGGASFADYILLLDDINNDGKVDVVWVTTNADGKASSTVSVRLNESTSSTVNFVAGAGVAIPEGGSIVLEGEISIVDVDGDGRLDLLRTVVDSHGKITARSVNFGKGNGGFSTSLSGVAKDADGKIISVGEQIKADFNGDGVLDLLFRDANNHVRIALGDATQANGYRDWQSIASPDGYGFKDSLAAVDVDGDGRKDLVWVKVGVDGTANGQLSVQLSQTTLASTVGFAAAQSYGGTGVVSLVDLDGDGRLDLVRAVLDKAGNAIARSVNFGAVGGGFGANALQGKAKDAKGLDISLGEQVKGDFNGDGVSDLLFRDANNQVRIALGDATHANGYRDWVTVNAAPAGYGFKDSLAVVDFDQDGKLDLAWIKADAQSKLTGAVTLMRGTGDISAGAGFSAFGTPGNTYDAGTVGGQVSFSDVNGDGRLDLLRTIKSAAGNIVTQNVYWGLANGGFSNSVSVTGQAKLSAHGQVSVGELSKADVNGDGLADLVFRAADNSVSIALANATKANGYGDWQTFTAAVPSGFTFQDDLTVRDINGDGKADLLWVKVDAEGRANGQAAVRLSAGGLDSVSFDDGGSNTASGQVSLTDIDGDGRLDLVSSQVNVAGFLTAQSVYFGKAGGFISTPVNGVKTLSTDEKISLGELSRVDINGDGLADLVFRQANDTVRIAL
ncbi:MAG: FG-GAP repeat domain-containing protein, partial [bacterium]